MAIGFRGVAACFVMFVMANCAAADKDKVQGMAAVDSSMQIPAAQVASFERKALDGDKDAAFRLFLHYGMPGDQQELAQYWLRIAAENDHPVAQYNMWFVMRESANRLDKQRALFWLRRSAALGEEMAIKKLQEELEQR